MTAAKPTRCAIYTRKSSEEGLDQDFNSLDAQREACAAYIASQRAEGWIPLETCYDDGGLSGGSLDRPALQRLFGDIDRGRVDMVVVYKIDRLTRSLLDFAKLIERFDAAGASFVAVTQHFNTSTSMGRLTLNVLLSFAQFEREITAERIRDKIAASKKKGMWMGGVTPLGYDLRDRALIINRCEADTVRKIYQSYLDLGNVRAVKEAADGLDLRSKRRVSARGRASGGGPLSRGALYKILSNPIYIGAIRHRNLVHEGRHAAVIDSEVWQAVQAKLAAQAVKRHRRSEAGVRSPLAGRLFDETGDRLTPSHACKGSRRYRYYISQRLTTTTRQDDPSAWRLPASELERAVAVAALAMLDELPTPTRLADRLETTTTKQALENGKIENVCDLVNRADISANDMRLVLDGEKLATLFPGVAIDASSLTRSVPFQIRRRGVEAKLITDAGRRAPDKRIVALIAKSQRYWHDIKSGRSLAAIARREGVTPTWIRQVSLLAFLAPNIVEACLDGCQPPELSAKVLLTTELPLDWHEQHRHLGFEPELACSDPSDTISASDHPRHLRCAKTRSRYQ